MNKLKNFIIKQDLFLKDFGFPFTHLHPYVLVVIYLHGRKPKSIYSGSSYLKLVMFHFSFYKYISILKEQFCRQSLNYSPHWIS